MWSCSFLEPKLKLLEREGYEARLFFPKVRVFSSENLCIQLFEKGCVAGQVFINR